MASLITKIPRGSIIMMRDGKRLDIAPDAPFQFTQAEIDDILAVNPQALRDPVNESPVAQVADESKVDPKGAATGKGKGKSTGDDAGL